LANETERTDEALAGGATTEEREALLGVLPLPIRRAVEAEEHPGGLLEVVLDLGRAPEARFLDRDVYLSEHEVSAADLHHVIERVGLFGDDNRAGIERTLHRISAIRNRAGDVVGLTCRVGRAISGSARVIEDLALAGNSVLLLGRPGVGKTTILRELARVVAGAGKRVVIVDTSNEIAGDGDIPHPAIGRARRMQVRTPAAQHAVMIEAVENHMPQVIIVDEMGTELEAAAARTIAERGVQLIATAHGNTLENLLANPTLSDLVGGIQTVTLSDEEARRRRTQKTILERKAPPTFTVLVEIQSWNKVAVHTDVARTVDAILRGRTAVPELRELDEHGGVRRSKAPVAREPGFPLAPFGGGPMRERGPAAFEEPEVRPEPWRRHLPPRERAPEPEPVPLEQEASPARPALRVLPFGVSRERLEEAAASAGMGVDLASSVGEADVLLTTKAHFRRRSRVLDEAAERGVPVFVLRRNTPGQIGGFLEEMGAERAVDTGENDLAGGRDEAEDGVERILAGEADAVTLRPQSSFVRRIQHRIAEQARLRSRSEGRDPHRRVTIRRG
jgi:stage III sporulation protein SpoIIIAA